ncbi:MAG: hypothetical protein ABIF01_00450 [Candidatus Micrarchaeota archaeon]
MKLSSDLYAGISLLGVIVAIPSALLGIVLLISKGKWVEYYGQWFAFLGAFPAFLVGLIVFIVFFRESKRMRQVEAEEELIRKLAIEKLARDKLSGS